MAGGSEAAVLVLTDVIDPTADLVVAELEGRGVPVMRCNPGDFPQKLTLVARLDGESMSGRLVYADRHTGRHDKIALDAIRCGYYRRPSAFRLGEHVPEQWRFWAAREARQGFGGVVSAIPRWLNHPADIAFAEYKPVQLRYAAECGLTIPRTLVTNDPGQARRFADEVGAVVHKGLSSSRGPGDPFTHIVDPDDIGVAETAHLFQEYVSKAYEIRLTVVDQVMWAVRIDVPPDDAGVVDWRAGYDSYTYSVITVPSPLRAAVKDLMYGLRLRFAALDFGVTHDGELVFFEINPNGQWAWLQERIGLDIAHTIADALTCEDRLVPAETPIATCYS